MKSYLLWNTVIFILLGAALWAIDRKFTCSGIILPIFGWIFTTLLDIFSEKH